MQWAKAFSVDLNRTADAAELIQKGAFLNFEDAYTEIFEYIELYYNRKRRHSSINYDIPDLFEEKFKELKRLI